MNKNKNMFNIIKPVPVVAVTALTLVGILMHDMHIDKATAIAVAPTTSFASTGAYEKVISQNFHTHVERVSIPKANAFRSSLPNIAPPRDDERRYVQSKKLLFMGGGDTSSLWPSI